MPQRRNIAGLCSRCGKHPNRPGQRTCKFCHAEYQKEARLAKQAVDFRAGYDAALQGIPFADALAYHLGPAKAQAVPSRVKPLPPRNQLPLFES